MTTSELSNAELRRRVAELEAENGRLHDRLNVVINDREQFVSLMNEARQIARHYRRRYLHVKRHIMERANTRSYVTRGWLPSDDFDSIPF